MRSQTRSALLGSRLRWVGLGIALCVLTVALPAAGQEQTAVVRSDPAVIELTPGQTATVSVVLAEARAVYGIDVRAIFDPQLVEVVDADPALEGVQFTPGAFPQPDFVVRNEADNQAGTLRYAITQVNPTEPASGDGIIFTVQLRAKAENGEGTFTIGPVEMADRSGVLLPVQAENGLIRIVAADPAAPTATAMPTATPLPAQAAEPVQPAPVEPSAPAEPETNWPLLAVIALLAGAALLVLVIVRRRAAG